MEVLYSVFSPNKKVEEDDNWEEEASAGGVLAEKQHKVTERTEQQHPQHVQLKEQEEAIDPRQSRHAVLQSGHNS